MRKHLLTVAVAMSLSACGGSSDDGGGGSGIFAPPTGELATRMQAISVKNSQVSLETQCGVSGTVLETDNLVVGFSKDSTNKQHKADLAYAAQMAQVGLNELVQFGQFDKYSDLGLDEQNKWFVCFINSMTGNGTGFVGGMEFSPSGFDNLGLHLTKHELFHTIQSQLLNDEYSYLHLPFWFQEATAEFFALDGELPNLPGSFMTAFLNDVYDLENRQAETPFGVDTWNTDQDIRNALPEYGNYLYKIYSTALNYLTSRDLTKQDMLDLTRDSYQSGQDFVTRPKFHEAVKNLEADGKLNLPTGYEYVDLKTSDIFKDLVVNDWLGSTEYTASFTSVSADILIGELFLIPESDTGEEYNIPVASDQHSYSYPANSVLDGEYNIYAIDIDDTNIYGPIQQSVIEGELGNIDFTDVGICDHCDDD
jgi:hypothetical protein